MGNGRPVSRRNHYVPVWYQRGFLRGHMPNFFLDVTHPDLRPDGTEIFRKAARKPPKSCFWAEDLYVTRFGEKLNDDIETVLFAGIDDKGAGAVRAFIDGDVAQMHSAFEPFFAYMGAQKFRTPKGLEWIQSRYPALNKVELMVELQHLRHLYGTLWAESVPEIVFAEASGVKFIVSDHPVTTFNPVLPIPTAGSPGGNEAPVDLNGTQTVFVLDANHCLILTHLSYAQAPEDVDLAQRRENARAIAPTLIRTDALIRSRSLDAGEVIAINHLLKVNARQYIAAADEEWLYPERTQAFDADQLAMILRPPKDGLFRFGGEIYIGYKDGSVGYRDAVGHTSRAHELVSKKPPEGEPADVHACPCGNGKSYKDCCKDRPAAERPPWTVLGLWERNMALLRAINGILGLDAGKSWDDVRRDLSDEEVIRLYGFIAAMWPEDTDLAALLPRPESGAAKAVYMGLSDPRTVQQSIIDLIPAFDQIFVLCPFINPVHIRPEMGPMKQPGAFKTEVLKHALFVLTLGPLVECGRVVLFPDPGGMVAGFRESMWQMARDRTGDWQPSERDMAEIEPLMRQDFERTISSMPDDALRSDVRRVSPQLDDEMVEGVAALMRRQHDTDPLALLQPMEPGEGGARMLTIRFVTLELALFVAQLTGAAVLTDIRVLWEQLHRHTRAGRAAGQKVDPKGKIVLLGGRETDAVLEESFSPSSEAARQAIGAIYGRATDHGASVGYDDLIDEVNASLRGLSSSDTANGDRAAQDVIALDVSIPEHGFESPTVQRLIVAFGRDAAAVSVPIAFYRPWAQ